MQSTFSPITFNKTEIKLLNQTLLPRIEEYEVYSDYLDMTDAIKKLKVRGAPLIGIAAAYGISAALNTHSASSLIELLEFYKKLRFAFYQTRPTAKNLFYALDRLDKVVENPNISSVDQLRESIEAEAIQIHKEDELSCLKIAENAANTLFNKKDNYTFLTHCNTGSLATGGIGTALGIIKYLHNQGKNIHVYVDETRPLLQGARLTAWELHKERIPYTLITDNMAAQIMKNHHIDAVVVGADRITKNGDSANKIGTFQLAIVASYFNVPFYIVAPKTTFDTSLITGDEIEIEIRDDLEVTRFNGIESAPIRSKSENYAFDVTPNNLISGIVTEDGVYFSPYKFCDK
ncbi:S-methyl-5-thioribose-1-phosphate isomerase [bacterium]|nr:S-methyl-5-thioribose-1-phosphate isomerase [bacterium]